MNTNHFDHPPDNLPEDLREVAAQLHELGARDRASTVGLEDRLFAVTRHALPGAKPMSPIGRIGPAPAKVAGSRLWSPVRLAAAVAICSAGAALWLATATWSVNHGAPTQAEQAAQFAQAANADMTYLVALAGFDDDWDPFNERLDVLRLETEAVAGSRAWELGWGGLLLTEGVIR